MAVPTILLQNNTTETATEFTLVNDQRPIIFNPSGVIMNTDSSLFVFQPIFGAVVVRPNSLSIFLIKFIVNSSTAGSQNIQLKINTIPEVLIGQTLFTSDVGCQLSGSTVIQVSSDTAISIVNVSSTPIKLKNAGDVSIPPGLVNASFMIQKIG